jgi:hypothetical protein
MRVLSYQETACLILVAATAGALSAQDQATGNQPMHEDRPFLALWQREGGILRPNSSLRFAVWPDGRVLYAKEPDMWGSELRRGKMSPSRVARLKAALADTRVFDLKRTNYLAPDSGSDCLLVELGGKQRILYWDELETPCEQINPAPEPRYLEFKRCWKAINHLGLIALPNDGEAVKEPFPIPESWYLKRAKESN